MIYRQGQHWKVFKGNKSVGYLTWHAVQRGFLSIEVRALKSGSYYGCSCQGTRYAIFELISCISALSGRKISGYFLHRGAFGRYDLKVLLNGEYLLEELQLQGTNRVIESFRLIRDTFFEVAKPLAVLTCVGNTGSAKIFVKNKGHSAMVIGGKVFSFEAGGYKVKEVKEYMKDNYNVRPVVVQEIDIGRHGDASVYAERYIKDRIKHGWHPIYYLNPLYFANPIAWLLAAFGVPPFIYPGGMCSTQAGASLKLDPPGPDTPKKIFLTLRKHFSLAHEYYIFLKSGLEIGRAIDKWFGQRIKIKHSSRLEFAQYDARRWK